MKRTLSFSLFLLVLSFISHAQSEHYYYYQGKKIFLELDPQYLFVTSHHQKDITLFQSSLFKSSTDLEIDRSHVTVRKIPDTENLRPFFWKKVALPALSEKQFSQTFEAFKKQYGNIIMAPYFRNQQGQQLYLSNYFYVKLNSAEDIDQLKTYAQEQGVELIGQNRYMPLWYTLSVAPDTPNAMQMANDFYESGLFAYAEPDITMENPLLSAPNDPFYTDQWGLKNTGQPTNSTPGIDINAEPAWALIDQYNIDLSAIDVAVIDDGVEGRQQDLNVSYGYDAHSGMPGARLHRLANNGPQTNGQHGTAVAGIIGAYRNNNLGVVGVAPGVKIIPVSFNESSNSPNRIQQLADAINWAAGSADVINCSWIASEIQSITTAINNAVQNGRGGKGCVVVGGSGNLSEFADSNSNQTVAYPAALPNVIAVGAISPCGERKTVDSCDEEQWASGRGDELSVVAPGVDIVTTDTRGSNGYNPNSIAFPPNDLNYGVFGGTSAATPFVSGLAALILAVDPSLTAEDVKSIIESSARKVGNYTYSTSPNHSNGTWNSEMGYGLIDAHKAVFFAKNVANPIFLNTVDDICSTAPVTLELTNVKDVDWTTSSNLEILSSTNHSITVKRKSTMYSGNGWVRATNSDNGQYFQHNIWVGIPGISIPPLPFFCPDQYNQINFPIVHGASSYKLSWSNTNIDFIDVFNNQWFSYPLNYLRFYGSEGDYIATFQAKNDCGEIRTNHFEVRINAANANCGGGGGPGPIIIRREVTPPEDELTPVNLTPDGVTVFPNPVEDVLNIRIPGQVEVHGIYILNMNGQKLRTIQDVEPIDIKNLKSGMYVIQIQTDTEIITKRFIRN